MNEIDLGLHKQPENVTVRIEYSKRTWQKLSVENRSCIFYSYIDFTVCIEYIAYVLYTEKYRIYCAVGLLWVGMPGIL